MDVTINQHNLEHIGRKVQSGGYSCADDVVERALTLLDDADDELKRELADTRESVARATAQADAGRLIPADVVFAELRRRNEEMRRKA